MILLLHCALSFFRNGVTGAFGVDCNEEAPDGAIESCCTMKNLAVITRELPSSLVCGRMLDNVACVNVNGGRCTQIVPGYHPCAKTTTKNGDMSAEIINIVVLSLMNRGVHVGLVPAFGSSCEADKTFIPKLDDEIRAIMSNLTTHPQNLSTRWCKSEEAQNGLNNHVLDSWDQCVSASVEAHLIRWGHRVPITNSMKQLAHASPLLPYASNSIQDMYESLGKISKMQGARVAWFSVASRIHATTPLLEIGNMPDDCRDYVLKNMQTMMSTNKVNESGLRVNMVLSLMGKNSMALHGYMPDGRSVRAVEMGSNLQAHERRSQYDLSRSECWKSFHCTGDKNSERCPVDTIHYHGDKTELAKLTKKGSSTIKRVRKCAHCGSHTRWNEGPTISDEDYRELSGGI